VSSLHRLKDTDNNDGGFFVFGDLSVKMEGTFRLQFTLYEVRDKEVEFIKSIQSDDFTVYASKNWPGMAESTFLTRSFSDQGVRLRLRKEPRFRLGQRGPASDDYQPRHYNRGPNPNRRLSHNEYGQPPQQQQLHGQSQRLQDTFSQSQQGYMPAPRNINVPGEYPAYQSQHAHPPNPVLFDNTRKRDFHQASTPGPHDSSHYGQQDEHAMKRLRPEVSDNSLKGQQYAMQNIQPQYGGRQFMEPAPVNSFASFSSYAQPPQPQQLQSQQPQTAPPLPPPQSYNNYAQHPQSAAAQQPGVALPWPFSYDPPPNPNQHYF
jgi:hypothetical protein